MSVSKRFAPLFTAFSASIIGLLAGCGGGSSHPAATYPVNVHVVGLSGQGLDLQNNGANDLAVAASGTSAFSTSLMAGAAYSVTVHTQPTSPAQVCTVSGGSGTIAAAAVTVTVTCVSTGAFAYVPNDGDGTLSAYSISPTTGALTPFATPITVPASNQLWDTKVDPSGKYLYVLSFLTNTIYGYVIQSDGTLLAAPSSPYATGNGPYAIAFDSTGAYLYVLNDNDGTISGYSIDAATGQLAELTAAGSPFAASAPGAGLWQVGRSGNHLYVSEFNNNGVGIFAINSSTGALTEITGSPVATDVGPYGITVDPSGAVAYVPAQGAGNVGTLSAYTINSSTGAMTAVAGNPLPINVYNYIAVDPQSKFLFVTQANGVSVYPINTSTGVLGTLVAGSPFSTTTAPPGNANPFSVSIDPTDQFVYVTNDVEGTVAAFTLNTATGVLTPVAGSPYTAGVYPDFVAIR